MKAIYWRPQTSSPRAILIIGLASLAGLVGLYLATGENQSDQRIEELAASRLADKCLQSIKAERMRLGYVIDQRFDPHHTGMIGEPISAATSKVANLSAKQVSVNPNFAAAVVHMLVDAGVQPGDTIAVGWTGSFPALNVALCAAIETMELKPIIVASALSSQYGANADGFLWLDMEKHLAESELISFRSSAMTIGGAADRAFGGSREAVEVVGQAHERTGVAWLNASNLQKSVEARMKLYDRLSEGEPIAVYINVGGGIASMGGSDLVNHLRSGVNRHIRSIDVMPDCVARRFASNGQPVIHLAHARTLAERYHLNTDLSQLPIAGVGSAFDRHHPSRVLAACLLVAIGVLLHAFVTRDYGYRALNRLMVPFRAQVGSRKEFRIVGEPIVSQLMV